MNASVGHSPRTDSREGLCILGDIPVAQGKSQVPVCAVRVWGSSPAQPGPLGDGGSEPAVPGTALGHTPFTAHAALLAQLLRSRRVPRLLAQAAQTWHPWNTPPAPPGSPQQSITSFRAA